MNRSFNKALNKEPTVYGLKITGLIFGAVGSVIAILKLGIMWFVLGAVPGYMIGVIYSNYWHLGKLQRWLYWNTRHYFHCFVVRNYHQVGKDGFYKRLVRELKLWN